MTNKEAIKLIQEIEEDGWNVMTEHLEALNLAINALENRPTDEWIPVKYRSLTTEERKEFAEHYGSEYSDEIDEKVFDCPMPEDGQEILVSSSWGVREDIAENDALLNGFNTYGLEGNGDWEGIDAWMPMPEPYKKGEEE